MRHVFILNPAAGKKSSALTLIPEIKQAFRTASEQPTIHITDEPGKATRLARQEAEKGDPVRLYACGGDGTLLEVASGLVGCENAELACIPCGSGNDFVRTMPCGDRFRNVAAQVAGAARPLDAIQCNDRLSVNLCSMGMDADVGAKMVDYKHLPLVSGSMAYNLAVANVFCGKLGSHLRVVMETENGTVEREGDYLFALAANGRYYGGGYHGSPNSKPDDGLLDFVLVKKISHLQVLRFLGKYKRGEHLGLSICETFRGSKMTVYAKQPTVVNADGECFKTTEVTFSILPSALNFVIPGDEMLKNCEISETPAVTP